MLDVDGAFNCCTRFSGDITDRHLFLFILFFLKLPLVAFAERDEATEMLLATR